MQRNWKIETFMQDLHGAPRLFLVVLMTSTKYFVYFHKKSAILIPYLGMQSSCPPASKMKKVWVCSHGRINFALQEGSI